MRVFGPPEELLKCTKPVLICGLQYTLQHYDLDNNIQFISEESSAELVFL